MTKSKYHYFYAMELCPICLVPLVFLGSKFLHQNSSFVIDIDFAYWDQQSPFTSVQFVSNVKHNKTIAPR